MAIHRLTDNDVSSLAQIFDITLQSYCKHFSPMEKDYAKELSIIMGLGFTTALVDGDLLSIYERRLQIFIQYRNFKAHPGAIGILSRAIAEMIDGAVYLFRLTKHPQYDQYHEVFVAAVRRAVEHIRLCEVRKTEEAERLMRILFQSCH